MLKLFEFRLLYQLLLMKGDGQLNNLQSVVSLTSHVRLKRC